MAHIDDGGGNGRSVGVDLNIVPIIDLMSVLIVFLLITAVWNQISMIQLSSSVYGKNSGEKVEVPPEAKLALRVDILKDRYVVNAGTSQMEIPSFMGAYDKAKLLNEMKLIKTNYPKKEDVVLTVYDDLEYGGLVGGMDVLITAGFPQISIATGSVE